jgi:type IV pilus assembly protein PilO
MALKDFKFENLSRSTQLIVALALAAGLTSLGYMLYLKEPIQRRNALQTEVRKLEVAVAQATAVESQITRFKQELAQLDLRLQELRRILPNHKETPNVLRSVQEMAAASNLKILKFNPQPVAPHDFYSDWPITLEVEGSYNSLGVFFERIGKFTRIINVDNILVKGLERSADANRTLTSNCTATTFVFREEQVPAPTGN